MISTEDGQPIRVAFVLHVMGVAGAEILVTEIIRGLNRRIEPTVFCLDNLGSLGKSLKEQNIPVVAFGRRPGLDLAVSRHIALEIRKRRCQIVHAHQYTPFFYAALAKLQAWPRFQLIFTEHGRHYPDVVSFKRYWTNKIFLSRMVDDVTAVCRFSAKSLKKVDGITAPIDIIPNGINLNNYTSTHISVHFKSALGLDPGTQHIVCIARFHPVKDHSTLLRAFSKILRLRKNIELILVGDGPLRGSLEHEARSLGISDHLKFFGIRNDISQILKAADVFVLPSLSEAASITLMEAMASAVPVVVTDVGGNPEIVRHGLEGLLVPRGNDKAMASACLKVLTDPELGREMGRKGREKIEKSHRLEIMVNEYYKKYQSAVRRLEH